MQTKPISYIEIEVNGHKIKVTTDQEVTQQYMKDLAAHIRKIEAGQAKKSRK